LKKCHLPFLYVGELWRSKWAAVDAGRSGVRCFGFGERKLEVRMGGMGDVETPIY